MAVENSTGNLNKAFPISIKKFHNTSGNGLPNLPPSITISVKLNSPTINIRNLCVCVCVRARARAKEKSKKSSFSFNLLLLKTNLTSLNTPNKT
jgi:hypothetical protein